MLPTRSARLAALLLLALLFGWTVRSSRKGKTTNLPPPAPIAVPLQDTPPSSFPDE
ncbi:MAG: hypothetical protein WAW39_00640 [Prosthecobacter sp.]|uniref:hypothetical protein n=1 Tax=Prosthecobacter sp. TaxID=1965333 RepID=UPI003BAFF770